MPKYKIIKDCYGNLLYKKEIETDEHFRYLRKRQTGSQHDRDESLLGNWEHVSSIHILKRIDRNFSPHSKYRKQYKCNYCKFTDSYNTTIQNHLIEAHNIDADYGAEKRCHACKNKYNELYEEEKYMGWGEYKRRVHHWEKCCEVQERINSYISPEPQTWTSSAFDTTSLPVNTRYDILNCFERKYISSKHIYSECQPQYIDSITTAYRSDIMKEIMYQQ